LSTKPYQSHRNLALVNNHFCVPRRSTNHVRPTSVLHENESRHLLFVDILLVLSTFLSSSVPSFNAIYTITYRHVGRTYTAVHVKLPLSFPSLLVHPSMFSISRLLSISALLCSMQSSTRRDRRIQTLRSFNSLYPSASVRSQPTYRPYQSRDKSILRSPNAMPRSTFTHRPRISWCAPNVVGCTVSVVILAQPSVNISLVDDLSADDRCRHRPTSSSSMLAISVSSPTSASVVAHV
jgi:hypothetical protein